MKKYICWIIVPLVLLWLLTKLSDVIFDKLFGWSYTFFGLFIFIVVLYYLGCFIWLLIKLVATLFKSLKEGRMANRYVIITFLIFTLVSLEVFFDPLGLVQNVDKDKGVLLQAQYMAPISASTLSFRDNDEFEIINYPLFSKTRGASGSYHYYSDTLFLKFDTRRPVMLSDTLLIRDNYLYYPLPREMYTLIKDTLMTTHFKIWLNKLE